MQQIWHGGHFGLFSLLEKPIPDNAIAAAAWRLTQAHRATKPSGLTLVRDSLFLYYRTFLRLQKSEISLGLLSTTSAQKVYRSDQEINLQPRNGWSILGMKTENNTTESFS